MGNNLLLLAAVMAYKEDFCLINAMTQARHYYHNIQDVKEKASFFFVS